MPICKSNLGEYRVKLSEITGLYCNNCVRRRGDCLYCITWYGHYSGHLKYNLRRKNNPSKYFCQDPILKIISFRQARLDLGRHGVGQPQHEGAAPSALRAPWSPWWAGCSAEMLSFFFSFPLMINNRFSGKLPGQSIMKNFCSLRKAITLFYSWQASTWSPGPLFHWNSPTP